MASGWHTDPYGRYQHRYHDGSNWTETVSNGGGTTFVDPVGAASPAPAAVQYAPPSSGPHPITPGAAYASPGAGSSGAFNGFPGSPVARIGARIIDALLISVPLYFLLSAVFGSDGSSVGSLEESSGFEMNAGTSILMMVIFAAYEIGMVGSMGRTVGKIVCGVTVVRASDGSVPGYPVAAIRYLGFVPYAIPVLGQVLLVISVLMMALGARRQTIHDLVASTLVAKTSS